MLKKYATETSGRIKDRMMLIIRIKRDGMGACEAARSLGKSESGGCKWYARYRQAGFDNLDDRPHTGRPPKVDRTVMKKIRKNARKKLIWTANEMQDYTLRNAGTKYNIAHVRYLLRRWGYTQKVPVGVHANRASAEEIYTFQKEIADVIKKRREGNSHRNTGRIHSGCRAAGTKTWLHKERSTCILHVYGLTLKDHSVRTAYHRRQEDVQTVRQV